MRRGSIAVCAALAAAGVVAALAGRDGAPDRDTPTRSPDAAVTAYVAGYNARDGAAICGLLAPEVAAAVRRLLAVPGRARGCADALADAIQRPSDRDTSEGDGYTFWSKATVLARSAPRRDGITASVDLRLRHEKVADILTSESGCRSPLTRAGPPPCRSPEDLPDRISLERREGRWLVTGMGAIFYVAIGQAVPPSALDAPLAPSAAARSARLAPPPRPCSRAIGRVTRHADRDPAGSRIEPYLDIRAVAVRRLRSGAACIAVTLAAPPGRATEIGVNFAYVQDTPIALDPRMPAPRADPRSRGSFPRCGVSTLLIDGDGRPDARVAAEFGLMDRTRVPRAAAGAARGSKTIEFLVEPLDGRAGGTRGLRRLSVGAFADSRRDAGPGRYASRRADTLPNRDGVLVADAAGGREHASTCALNRPQVGNRELVPIP
ncbi:MAG TPA: hypothetical protein VGO80_02105 [Solirubrobacteraceae bacterium]|jgi:hypothetical protein|nr:hypothetical protein [Solirubrobacteraceae bacterium]